MKIIKQPKMKLNTATFVKIVYMLTSPFPQEDRWGAGFGVWEPFKLRFTGNRKLCPKNK